MKKCAKCGGSMYKTGGSTMKTKLDVPKGKIYGIPQTGGTGPITMKKGGSTAVKHSCPPGTVRSATGGCVSERPRFKKGGAVKPLAKKQAGGSNSPQTMKEYVKKYKKSGSVTYGMHDINPSAATDTLYEQGPYRRFLSEDPKKKEQVADLIRVHDNKFYPNGKLTTNPKDRKEVLDAGKRKKGGVVRKAVVKKKK